MPLAVCYFHGLGSSPDSPKARLLRSLTEQKGFRWHAPDFNRPDFSSLTVTRILEQARTEIATIPADMRIALIGSSLGGFCAATYVATRLAGAERVQRLVLLAPAFRFDQHKKLTPQVQAEWRHRGSIPKWHTRENRELPLGVGFLEDILQYDPLPRVTIPTLVIHGREDETIDIAHSREFTTCSTGVILKELATGHEMENCMDEVEREVSLFLD